MTAAMKTANNSLSRIFLGYAERTRGAIRATFTHQENKPTVGHAFVIVAAARQ